MSHSWCRDIPRDEAIRAAEDAAANWRPAPRSPRPARSGGGTAGEGGAVGGRRESSARPRHRMAAAG